MLDGLSNIPSLGERGAPPAQPVTAWVRYEDGSLGSIIVTGGKLPELARPGRFITREEFNQLTVAMAEGHATRLEAMGEEDTVRQVREYRDLTRAGIPDETARRLTGYTGPANTSSTTRP